jgi:hypothetical protein
MTGYRVDTTAPFYDFVLELDEIVWADTIARRNANRAAASPAPRCHQWRAQVVSSPAPPAGTDAGDGT